MQDFLEIENEKMKELIRHHIFILKKLDEQVGGLIYKYPAGDRAELRELFEFQMEINKCREIIKEPND